jgi:hypothetical protein
MRYLERLRSGSDFHKVSPVSKGFKIRPANDNLECRERFNAIVDEAVVNASVEGYEIIPHRSSSDPRGWWDFAVITVR